MGPVEIFSDVRVLAVMTFGVISWIKVEFKKDNNKSEVGKIGWLT